MYIPVQQGYIPFQQGYILLQQGYIPVQQYYIFFQQGNIPIHHEVFGAGSLLNKYNINCRGVLFLFVNVLSLKGR